MATNRKMRRAGAAYRRATELGPLAFREVPPSDMPRVPNRPARAWISTTYTALLYPEDGGLMRLSIKRNDSRPLEGWSLKQAIKRATVGDVEAIEVYPRDADLIDSANMYHLWFREDGSPVERHAFLRGDQ